MRRGCLMLLCCSPPHSPSASFCTSGAVWLCTYVLNALSPLSILFIPLLLSISLGSFPALGIRMTSLIAHLLGIRLALAMPCHSASSLGAITSSAMCRSSAGLVSLHIALLFLHLLNADLTSAVVASMSSGIFPFLLFGSAVCML